MNKKGEYGAFSLQKGFTFAPYAIVPGKIKYYQESVFFNS